MRARDDSGCTPSAASGRINDACIRYGVGKNTMRTLAEKAGAVIRIGRIFLINYKVMDSYMDELTSEKR